MRQLRLPLVNLCFNACGEILSACSAASLRARLDPGLLVVNDKGLLLGQWFVLKSLIFDLRERLGQLPVFFFQPVAVADGDLNLVDRLGAINAIGGERGQGRKSQQKQACRHIQEQLFRCNHKSLGLYLHGIG